jgi:hypothetical protein
LSNVLALFPAVWERANDDLRKTVGLRYHTLTVDPSTDDSADKGARTRLLNFLVAVGGVRYVPDAARALLYRKAAKDLAAAKDTSYGWAAELTAATTLKQFGPYVPTIAFEEVYQEIMAVWCGNYWGRSGAETLLREFIDVLNADQLRRIVEMFRRNDRVRDELFQTKPRAQAITFLKEIREKFPIQSHKGDVDDAIQHLPS